MTASILPKEIIVNIFEYLSLNDRLHMSLVCRSWHDISRMPLLWRKVQVCIPETKVFQFCEFMKTVSSVIAFQFQILWDEKYYHKNRKPVLQPDMEDAILSMINNWPNLKCLRISQEIPLIILPSMVKHITYMPVLPPYHNLDRVEDVHILSIAKHSQIEEIRICHVHLARYTDNSVICLLQAKASNLKCLSLDCYQLRSKCLAIIGTCVNLTMLSLSSCVNMDEYTLAAIGRLKFLKYLSLEEICHFSAKMCNVLKFNLFASLVHLLLANCESISEACLQLMVKKMPQLETFGINSCIVMNEELTKFLTDSHSIKTIAFDASVVDFKSFLENVTALNTTRHFNSICFCDIEYAFDDDMYQQHRNFILDHFTCKKCLFKYPNQYFICNCFCV